jgi:16S rRNA processing protein RimM
MDDLREWDVLVGRVSGRWDKALLRVAIFADAPGRFEGNAKLCAKPKGEARLLTVRTSKRQGKHVLLDCGLTTEDVDALTGAELFVHPSMRPQLPPDEFYLDELLGMRVVTEAGEEFGEIDEIIETPANDVYVTPRALIPAVPDFVVSTDWDARVVTVRDVPGLRRDG